MRTRVTDHKIIYVRFRKDLDDLISEESLKNGTPRATLVGRIMTNYIQTLSHDCKGKFGSLTRDTANLSSLSSVFFAKKGRAIERSLGKPMRITLKSTDETNIRLAAQSIGYTITQFRTAILVSWAVDEGLLGQKNNS